MPELRLQFAQKIAVKDSAGQLLYWINPSGAKRLISKELAQPFGNGRLVRSLVAIKHEPPALPGRPGNLSELVGQRYSHNHETPENPENVWTLRRLPRSLGPIFRQVVTDCMPRPKGKAKVIAFQPRPRLRKAA